MEMRRRACEAEGADLLIDLNGYIKGSRLGIAARRPAPVQLAYFGYPGTTGAAFYDYVLADRIVAPPEHAAFFSEAICRMPGCYLPTDDEQPIAPESLSRADCGLPADGFRLRLLQPGLQVRFAGRSPSG